MKLSEIIKTSDHRSNHMYFNGTYLYCDNDIVQVREVRENYWLVKPVATGKRPFEIEGDGFDKLRTIDVPNFYYRFNPKEVCEYPEFEYIYVYRSPRRSMIKGFTPERFVANNPLHHVGRMMQALDKGDVIFSDKLASKEGFMWYRGVLVGRNHELRENYRWMGE